MDKIYLALKISVGLLCIAIAITGISIAVLGEALARKKDEIEYAKSSFAASQALIRKYPKIVAASSGTASEERVTLATLNTIIHRTGARPDRPFDFSVATLANDNTLRVEFRRQQVKAGQLVGWIEEIERIAFPTKATKWAMNRDGKTGKWRSIKINFSLPEKAKEDK